MWQILIGFILICILFFLGIMLYDGNRFHVVEYTVHSHKLYKDEDIVVLSDLHNKSYGKENERLLQAIERLHPAGIYVAGDIITSKAGESMKNGISLMQKLGKKYPVYYGVGNHEHKLRLNPEKYGSMYREYEAALRKAGITLMSNTRVYDALHNVDICGLEIGREYYYKARKSQMDKEYIASRVGACQKDAFQILLAHNPEYFQQYAMWGADLVLSGHIHGGVMRLPLLGGVISPSFRLFPRYDGGEFHQNHTTMILSRGLGMHTLPIRIFNPGELIVVHLRHS